MSDTQQAEQSGTPPEEQSAERQVKTLEQYKQDLDVLLDEHMDKSPALANTGWMHILKKRDAKQKLDDVKIRIGKLKKEAGATLNDKDWVQFLNYLNNNLENIARLSTAQTIDLHQNTVKEKVVGVTGEVIDGTTEVASRSIRAITSLTAQAIGHVTEGIISTAALAWKGGNRGAKRFQEKDIRKAA